ncbi:MAG: sulfite exporter TauE/SafE family protein, partial [Actinomycetota bacterium]|nr:sulfite exporter TauE/SafE family protein [Actinomycetota bacterium]
MAAVALVAAVVQAATGLGFALVLGPALFALLDPENAIVAITVLGLALNALVLFGERRRPAVAWGEVRPILLAALPGSLCGVVVLRALPKPWLQIAVGVAVIGAAALRERARARAV